MNFTIVACEHDWSECWFDVASHGLLVGGVPMSQFSNMADRTAGYFSAVENPWTVGPGIAAEAAHTSVRMVTVGKRKSIL
jgi:hypothetical protein